MQIIGGVSRENILSVSEEILQRFLKLPENRNPERTGGYQTILDKRTGERYFINEIGKCLPEMDHDCFLYCQEKSDRLREKNATDGHISAWQSRDRGNHKYGGAIVASDEGGGFLIGRDLVGSFSGTYEHGEEALLLTEWMTFGWMTLRDVTNIMYISDNQIVMPLMRSCDDIIFKYYNARKK